MPNAEKLEYDFEKWLDFMYSADGNQIEKLVQEELANMPDVVVEWMKQRSTLPISASIIQEIFRSQEASAVHSYLLQSNIKDNGIDFQRFPAVRTMLFSQCQRVHFTKKHL